MGMSKVVSGAVLSQTVQKSNVWRRRSGRESDRYVTGQGGGKRGVYRRIINVTNKPTWGEKGSELLWTAHISAAT